MAEEASTAGSPDEDDEMILEFVHAAYFLVSDTRPHLEYSNDC